MNLGGRGTQLIRTLTLNTHMAAPNLLWLQFQGIGCAFPAFSGTRHTHSTLRYMRTEYSYLIHIREKLTLILKTNQMKSPTRAKWMHLFRRRPKTTQKGKDNEGQFVCPLRTQGCCSLAGRGFSPPTLRWSLRFASSCLVPVQLLWGIWSLLTSRHSLQS